MLQGARIFGSPAEIVGTVRARVRAELGLPMSIGVAHQAPGENRIAGREAGWIVVVDPETELEFLHKLPVAPMWGVGPATEARLAKIGVTTIGQLAESSLLNRWSDYRHSVGRKLTALARNRDPANPDAPARAPPAHNRRSDDLACDRARLQTDAPSSRRPHRRPAPRQNPCGPDDHGPRALCRFALGHAPSRRQR